MVQPAPFREHVISHRTIRVFAIFWVRLERVEEFERLVRHMAQRTQAEDEGVIEYQPFRIAARRQDLESQDQRYGLMEQWASKQALDAHRTWADPFLECNDFLGMVEKSEYFSLSPLELTVEGEHTSSGGSPSSVPPR
jgi:quinol monooxygenase YgiN